MIPQKVQIFSVQVFKKGTPKQRYRVRWRIDGRGKTRSFKTKAEAERLRSQLMVAQSQGLRFDHATGYPVEWSRSEATWWTWSSAWLALKWPHWAGHTRRSGVEALVAITPYMTSRRAPEPPSSLSAWLWQVGYRPDFTEPALGDQNIRWLERWSVALVDLTPTLLEVAITRATTRQDGRPMAATTSRRRRNSIKSVLDAAVRRGLITSNPMENMEWRAPKRSVAVDVSVVPSQSDVLDLVDHIQQGPEGGRRYAAFFGCVGIAGMRPSEVAGLRADDLTLPGEGWGLARLRGALTSPGTRYSGDGKSSQAKALKHRGIADIREVPLAPRLVNMLQCHLTDYPSSPLIFVNNAGNPVLAHNYGKVWKRHRAMLWPTPHPLSTAVAYDLRHSAASTMLAAGVNPAEVARRLGHSVDMLMRVYAGVFHDERDRANEKLDRLDASR